jgi:hypothetical protein
MRSGDRPGLQNRRAAGNPVTGGFDSHSLPPFFKKLVSGSLRVCRPPWKSLSRRTKFSTANFGRTRSSHVCLSAMVPAFAEPDIHSLSDPLRIVTED